MSEITLETLEIEQIAKKRFDGGYPDASTRAARYDRLHRFYAPVGGDQWPEDLAERPGKLHITTNIVRGFVDTEARLMSKLPRITIPPLDNDPGLRKRAEATEKLFQRFLDVSNFEQWFFTFNQTKSLYGQGVLKPFWNPETDMPDVAVVEQPQNLVFGWGDSDFSVLDWAIYHYEISPLQARLRFPDAPDAYIKPNKGTRSSSSSGGTHSDPLSQQGNVTGRTRTEYEQKQCGVWDYWYLNEEGTVVNCVLLNGHIVDGPTEHPEFPIIPYIPAESDHEPGSPDGRGTAELLLDIQMGLNRAITHYAQHVWDTTDPAFQLTGEDAPMTVPPGLVPRSGEIVAPGPRTRIEEIRSGVNNFPFDALINTYWQSAYRVTGLSEILFGGAAGGADSTGRSLAIQLESSINRLDPKRGRSYKALVTLLKVWHFMASKKNKKIDEVSVKEVIDGLNRWKIVAPEITPRDVIEHATNVANKVNAKLISLETGMDEIGVENPLEEIERIMNERSNANLFPGDAQAIAAVTATLQAIGQQQQAQAMAAQGTEQQDAAMADQQEASPTLMEDQNQPATGLGSAPPGGAEQIGGELQPLVRESGGESNPMSQLVLPRRQF